jgi:hypothetical protein
MKFSIYKLDGTLVEFRAVWDHSQFGPSIVTRDGVIHNLNLPVTHRMVKRAVGWTMCTLTPTINGKVESANSALSRGDAACSASEPGGYSKQRGRIASFGSALQAAGFNRVGRSALWQQYWEQQGYSSPSLRKRQ